MFSSETMAIFIIASTALALAPGPDNLFVLMQSALYGRRSGILVSLGLCTGLIVHTAAVSLGLAAIFQASPVAFNALKILGALYLLYLAIQAFRAGSTHLENNTNGKFTARALYLRGVIMNITNPKVSIFFIAFLPQFSDPARGAVSMQILVLGLLFMLVTILVFSAIACFAGYIGEWLRKSTQAQCYLNRVAGIIFVALAFKLATGEYIN